MSKSGRPSIWTEQLENDVISLFAVGFSGAQAAAYVGISYSTLKAKFRKDKHFKTKCKQKKLAKLLLANRNEMDLLQNGDVNATYQVLARHERAVHHRHMERIRREELKLKREVGGSIIPAVLNLADAVQEVNDAFVGKPEDDDVLET